MKNVSGIPIVNASKVTDAFSLERANDNGKKIVNGIITPHKTAAF